MNIAHLKGKSNLHKSCHLHHEEPHHLWSLSGLYDKMYVLLAVDMITSKDQWWYVHMGGSKAVIYCLGIFQPGLSLILI